MLQIQEIGALGEGGIEISILSVLPSWNTTHSAVQHANKGKTAAQALVWISTSLYVNRHADRGAVQLKRHSGTLRRGQFMCGPCWQFGEPQVRGEVYLHQEGYRNRHRHLFNADVL